MNLSIIIPLYNEETFIVELLDKLLEIKIPEYITTREIIIVDDFSNDNSYQKAKEYSDNFSDIQVCQHSRNQGKGAAVRTGINKAKGDVFLIQDADLELDPEDIPRMLDTMNRLNVEFVNGSRYLPGVDRPLSSYKRYIGNKFFTFLTSVLINVKLTDIACGYKLIHRNLYNQLKLRENRFGFESELIIKALRVKRNNVAEIPVRYFPRHEGEGKKLKNFDAFRIFRTIIKYGLLRMK